MLRKYLPLAVLFLIFLSIADTALASPTTTGGPATLPWETPLNTLVNSVTGPVAGAIALVAIAIAGALLVFSGEISDFGRRVAYLVLVLAILVAAASFLRAFFPNAATIGTQPIASSPLSPDFQR
jgi:type IV secretion system protein VirB2